MPLDKTFLNPDSLSYRKGVGIMILNQNRYVLVAQRINKGNLIGANSWQMPQGGIDTRETPVQAAFREMKEEVGTANARLIAESRGWLTYDLPKQLRTTLWGGRFFGQTQKWFLMEFLGSDDEINIHTRHPEFIAWQWVAPGQLCDLIVPFKQKLYGEILEEFREYL